MMQAAASAGLGRGRWYRQPRGDGELAVYEEVVQGQLHGLNPVVFDRIIVRAKGTSYAGYLHRGIPMEVADQQYPGAPEAAP
jgi:hypothetical protein